MRRLKLSQKKCFLTGKTATIGVNKPHSLHRTKRVVKPNLQKYTTENGKQVYISTHALRTLKKNTPLANEYKEKLKKA